MQIYQLLDEKSNIADPAWKLLSRLPFSPTLYKNILLLENIKNCESCK